MKKLIAAVLGLIMMAGFVFAEPAMGAGKTMGEAPQHHNKWRKKRAKRMHHKMKMKHGKKHWSKNKRNHHRHN